MGFGVADVLRFRAVQQLMVPPRVQCESAWEVLASPRVRSAEAQRFGEMISSLGHILSNASKNSRCSFPGSLEETDSNPPGAVPRKPTLNKHPRG